MTVSQLAIISAGALVVGPLVVASVFIAVGSRARPRYARALIGIDERSSSAPRVARHTSPDPAVFGAAPSGTSSEAMGLGPQALRDAVDVRSLRGAEVFV